MTHGKHTTAQDYGKIAVLMGGDSAEREISLLSGAAVLSALHDAGIDAQAVDTTDETFMELLVNGRFTQAFIALHGRGGEDGGIQGLLETLGMPYTGSGVLGSVLAMDKLRTKQIWQSAGLQTPAFVLLSNKGDVTSVCETLRYPVMVKPTHEGSSIGISKVDAAEDLMAAWQFASQFDACVLVEQWIAGKEYTAGILDGETLPLIRLETPNTFYDFEAKYETDTTSYLVPCGLEVAKEVELQAMSMAAFNAVGASGWGRVDFMLDDKGQPWLIELNTVPGLTDHSLVPMAAAAKGINFKQLVCRILDAGRQDQSRTRREAGCA